MNCLFTVPSNFDCLVAGIFCAPSWLGPTGALYPVGFRFQHRRTRVVPSDTRGEGTVSDGVADRSAYVQNRTRPGFYYQASTTKGSPNVESPAFAGPNGMGDTALETAAGPRSVRSSSKSGPLRSLRSPEIRSGWDSKPLC
jgi:hypothetical protein